MINFITSLVKVNRDDDTVFYIAVKKNLPGVFIHLLKISICPTLKDSGKPQKTTEQIR